MLGGFLMEVIETDTGVIIAGFKIDGFLDRAQYCPVCKSHLVYYEDYDAYFCPSCNIWTEVKCGDPECMYCPNRPDTPLPKD
jgi:hypothetical protein